MKNPIIYRTIWIYANCRPSESASIRCAWPDEEVMLYRIRNTRRSDPPYLLCRWLDCAWALESISNGSRHYLARAIREARRYDSQWEYVSTGEPLPRHISRRVAKHIRERLQEN